MLRASYLRAIAGAAGVSIESVWIVAITEIDKRLSDDSRRGIVLGLTAAQAVRATKNVAVETAIATDDPLETQVGLQSDRINRYLEARGLPAASHVEATLVDRAAGPTPAPSADCAGADCSAAPSDDLGPWSQRQFHDILAFMLGIGGSLVCVCSTCCALWLLRKAHRIGQRRRLDEAALPTASAADPVPSAPDVQAGQERRGVLWNAPGPQSETRVEMVALHSDPLRRSVTGQVHPLPGVPGAGEGAMQAPVSGAPSAPTEREAEAVAGLPSAPPIAFAYDLADCEASIHSARGRAAERSWTEERYVSPPHFETRIQGLAEHDFVHGEVWDRNNSA